MTNTQTLLLAVVKTAEVAKHPVKPNMKGGHAAINKIRAAQRTVHETAHKNMQSDHEKLQQENFKLKQEAALKQHEAEQKLRDAQSQTALAQTSADLAGADGVPVVPPPSQPAYPGMPQMESQDDPAQAQQ